MNPLKTPILDLEKSAGAVNVTNHTGSDSPGDTASTSSNLHDIPPTPQLLKGKLATWNAKVESLAGLEARGITRVLPEEKYGGGARGFMQMFLLWFSINLVANNIITGLLGPLVFSLGWVDCVCIVIFATGLSACGVSYTSTFGPISGNRTMVRVRIETAKKDSLLGSLVLAAALEYLRWFQMHLALVANLYAFLNRSSVDISWAIGLRSLPASSM